MRALIGVMTVVLLAIIFGAYCCASAQEEITVTTYYPSPYGVYNEMRANKLVVGDPDSSTTSAPSTNGVAKFKTLNADPSGAEDTDEGALYYSDVSHDFKYYDGSGWMNLSQGNLAGICCDGGCTETTYSPATGGGGAACACPAGFTRVMTGFDGTTIHYYSCMKN